MNNILDPLNSTLTNIEENYSAARECGKPCSIHTHFLRELHDLILLLEKWCGPTQKVRGLVVRVHTTVYLAAEEVCNNECEEEPDVCGPQLEDLGLSWKEGIQELLDFVQQEKDTNTDLYDVEEGLLTLHNSCLCKTNDELTNQPTNPTNQPTADTERETTHNTIFGTTIPFLKNIEKGDFVARGGCGRVYKALWKKEKLVALKSSKKKISKESAEREASILWPLVHPNIITLYGRYIDKSGRIYLVTQFAKRGNLRHAIENKEITTDVDRIYIALGIAHGVYYLHCSCAEVILHRDLKPDNIVLADDNKTPLLIDFGLAVKFRDVPKHTHPVGTGDFMAPEVRKDPPVYSCKSDVYSFGVLLWSLLENDASCFRLPVAREEGGLLFKEAHHPELGALVKACWDENPDHRPLFPEIISTLTRIEQMCNNNFPL